MSYHGSCHCGLVQVDAEIELKGLATCNCSMCGRTGAIMVFAPAEQVRITGAEHLTDYQFGKETIHHVFCKVCGGRPVAWGAGKDGAAWTMVNARCLDGVDVHTLEVEQRYDGKAL